MSFILAGAAWLVAALLGLRELRAWRGRGKEESDLFAYTGRRLVFRLGGLTALVAFGATLAAWELAPPQSPKAALTYIAFFFSELAALIVFATLDLRETRRTASEVDPASMAKRRILP